MVQCNAKIRHVNMLVSAAANSKYRRINVPALAALLYIHSDETILLLAGSRIEEVFDLR